MAFVHAAEYFSKPNRIPPIPRRYKTTRYLTARASARTFEVRRTHEYNRSVLLRRHDDFGSQTLPPPRAARER